MWPNERESIEHSAAQDETIAQLRAELQHVCDRLLRTRTELATSHEHIGALLSAIEQQRYTAPIGYAAATIEYANLEDAVIAARAWLRREAK